MDQIDPKGLLPGVHWKLRAKFLELNDACLKRYGMYLKVRSGTRTCREQNEQYGIGRTYNLHAKPVTGAQGCRSWHVLGRAIDADPVDAHTGAPLRDCAYYTRAGELWESMGGEWGGRWTSFGPCGDAGHFQWRDGLTMSQVCPDPSRCEEVTRAVIDTRGPPVATASTGLLTASAFLLGLALARKLLQA